MAKLANVVRILIVQRDSHHLHCTASDSAGSGRCWPARRKRSQSRLRVSDGKEQNTRRNPLRQNSHHTHRSSLPTADSIMAHTHLQDLLDAVDGGGEQRSDLLVVVVVVGVSQTHEEDVGWQARDQVHSDAARLQFWRDNKSGDKKKNAMSNLRVSRESEGCQVFLCKVTR